MDNLLSLFVRDFWGDNSFFNPLRESKKLSYPFNITETNDGRLVYEIAAIGLKPEEIDITLKNGILSVQGAKQFTDEEKTTSEKNIKHYRGMKNSTFRFEYTIPEQFDGSEPEVTLDKGLLTIEFKKVPSKEVKRIEVKTPQALLENKQ